MASPINTARAATGSSRRSFLKMLGGMPLAGVQDPALASSDSANFRKLRKAMWVWNVEPGGLEALRTFASDKGIDTLLWSLPPSIRAGIAVGDATAVSSVRALRAGGRTVFALTGDPSWVQSPQRMPQSLDQLLEAADDDRTAFDGISLDIEPNALPAWHDPARRRKLLDDTVTFYDMVRSKARQTALDAALNPVFAEIRLQDDQSLIQALVRRLDSVSLMAYRDSVEATMAWAAPAIAAIESIGVPWRLGVLVHASSEKGTSFVGRDRSAFEADMVALDDTVRSRGPSTYYRGLIFEDYNGLARMFRT